MSRRSYKPFNKLAVLAWRNRELRMCAFVWIIQSVLLTRHFVVVSCSICLSTFSYTSAILGHLLRFVELVIFYPWKGWFDNYNGLRKGCEPGCVPRLIQGYSQQVNLAACLDWHWHWMYVFVRQKSFTSTHYSVLTEISCCNWYDISRFYVHINILQLV